MSRENVEIISRGYEAWNRGDHEAFFEIFDQEIEWQLPDGGLHTGTYSGHEDVRKLLESYLEAFDELHIEPQQFFEDDDRVVVFARQIGRGRGSGVEVEIPVAHLWTMRNGRAARIEFITDREKALEAVGRRAQDARSS
jgi:ketosteroid isomerase-like protein